MKITKCDICEKTIEKGTKNIRISMENYPSFYSFEICSDCGMPVENLFKDKKLIMDETKKHGK